jgi:hypothetical protein
VMHLNDDSPMASGAGGEASGGAAIAGPVNSTTTATTALKMADTADLSIMILSPIIFVSNA